MAIRAKDIYQGRKKSRSHAGVIVAVILALIVGAILLFYGLREYAVYDENGNATIVLPWSNKQADDTAESSAPSPSISPSASPSESPSPSPSESPQSSPSTETPPESSDT